MHPKKWLKKHGKTQLSVANKMKVATSTVTRWFEGKGIDPTVIWQWTVFTNGEVTINDWVKIHKEGQRAKKKPKD